MSIKFELPLDIDRKLYQQLDYALVLTYTRAAKAAQEAVRLSLPRSFTIRNSFVSNGIRTEAATKNNPVAAVFGRTEGPFSIDFMIPQETGAVKTPTRGRRNLAIPVNINKGKKGLIAKQNRPKALLDSGDYKSTRTRLNRVFKVDESTPKRQRHGLEPGIYASHPRRKSHKTGSKGLTMLYAFEKKGKIKPRFEFRDTAIKAAQDAMPKLFYAALTEAIRTAR